VSAHLLIRVLLHNPRRETYRGWDDAARRCPTSWGRSAGPPPVGGAVKRPRSGADRDHVEALALVGPGAVVVYESKSAGRGCLTYDPGRDAHVVDRPATTEALRTALRDDQLEVHDQPTLTLATDRVDAVEALVRWRHPERGLLYPDEFLPLAEAVSLMDALATVVLDQALRQCAAWRRDGRDISVGVNLSASNLLDAELPALIAVLLANLDLPASALHLTPALTGTPTASGTPSLTPCPIPTPVRTGSSSVVGGEGT
jgi:hypothetical protein